MVWPIYNINTWTLLIYDSLVIVNSFLDILRLSQRKNYIIVQDEEELENDEILDESLPYDSEEDDLISVGLITDDEISE